MTKNISRRLRRFSQSLRHFTKMKPKDTYHAIGIMSGTSMDGLDLACCRFTKRRKWEFEIQTALTIRYPKSWKDKLTAAPHLRSEALLALDAEYGKFIGERCQEFIRKGKIKNVDVVASHGHTVFHQVQRGFTFQLGNGHGIHAATGLPVVYDFRSLDVALHGQGAPLVPMGDRHLFGEYDVCLNLGGIANLSMEKNDRRIAYDICFANMGLNYLAAKVNKEFDKDGLLAAGGTVVESLLDKLSAVYETNRKKRPALGREGFESVIQPLFDDDLISVEDRMRTFCESIAAEIRRSIPSKKNNLKLLATGGGALNPVLIKLLRQSLPGIKVEVPPRQIIEFKEAMVFAFLGVLRVRGEVNVLKSVTRASRDSCSGVVVG
jgi:anhydro-N-acetylmuramic acid kinase